MEEKEFLELFQETLQCNNPVSMDDSLAAMASIALAERRFSRRLKLKDLKQQHTVRDIYVLFTE